MILDEPGKWGNVKFIVSLSLDGSIKSMAVMEYKEIRGRPIASNSFMSQFNGKTLADKITPGNDIVAITGATISSEASCFTARKALVLYKELFMEKAHSQ
ncbi:FMN-binding protein [bacterium]|nr:MAG: FMN-binding protein [bacterium]